MYVPLCAVALTDVYKLPSDGGSGSSHINHCRRRVPHFQSSSAALTASFFSPSSSTSCSSSSSHWRQPEELFFFYISVTWKLFSNNSQMSLLVVLFLSSQGVTCCAVFSSVWLGPPAIVTSHQTRRSPLINHPSSRSRSAWHGSATRQQTFSLLLFFFFSFWFHRKHLKVGRAWLSQSWPLRMSLQVNVYAAFGGQREGGGASRLEMGMVN